MGKGRSFDLYKTISISVSRFVSAGLWLGRSLTGSVTVPLKTSGGLLFILSFQRYFTSTWRLLIFVSFSPH